MIKSKREIETTIGILSESSMEKIFLISIFIIFLNLDFFTCEKHSHRNIEILLTKRLTSGASSDNK